MILACGLFAFSVYAVKVETIRSPLQSKREGVVVVLSPDDPVVRELLLQVEERSPFPARWDPAVDEEVAARILATKSKLEGALWAYEMKLEPLPTMDRTDGLISITESGSDLFDVMPDQWRESEARDLFVAGEKPLIRVRVLASNELKSRISGDQLELPNKLVVEEGYGQIFRFQVALDSAGFVSNCIPLPGGTIDTLQITDRQKNLAAWLRAQRFSDDVGGGMVVGQLELQIEALSQ